VGQVARTAVPGTRERILGVASRLFYDHGVRAVGMNRIITEAGTGKNLLYQHFPAKSDLVAAYLEGARERRARATERALAAVGDDPREQLVALVAEVAEVVRRPGFRGCAFRNYLAEFPEAGPADPDSARPTPTDVAREHLAGSRALIDELVARLGAADPAATAEELWLLVDALYLQAAYRDRFDDDVTGGTDAAVRLARTVVDGARR
jgi:AcrR family transcriptional regulator